MKINLKIIEELIKGIPLNLLAKEGDRLSYLYRHRDRSELKPLSTDLERLAYISARLPSTYAVVCKVLRELSARVPGASILSLLDVGAGPGTVLLASEGAPFSLQRATLVERDPGFIRLGKRLCEEVQGVEQKWVCQDVTKPLFFEPHDLVVASYFLNEVKEEKRFSLIAQLWNVTGQFLVLIEPGSREGFSSLMSIREHLLSLGGHLLAPCPHTNKCPLAKGDWCHFPARLERSSLQRKVKGGTLNYEDEKFSYLIFSKMPLKMCSSRVIKRPLLHKRFIRVSLCSSSGIEEKTVTKKTKILYSSLKKMEWGEACEEPLDDV
jgi:ribosomal protein RSM22 (predicted rRNA methylase)